MFFQYHLSVRSSIGALIFEKCNFNLRQWCIRSQVQNDNATFSKYRMMSHKYDIYRLQIFESCWIQSHQILLHSKYIVVQRKFKTQQNIIHANVCMGFTRWWKMRTPWAGYSHSNNNRNLDLCRVLHNIFYVMLLIIAYWLLLHE